MNSPVRLCSLLPKPLTIALECHDVAGVHALPNLEHDHIQSDIRKAWREASCSFYKLHFLSLITFPGHYTPSLQAPSGRHLSPHYLLLIL